MAAKDPPTGKTDISTTSHPIHIVKPSATLKEGAQALPSQQSTLNKFVESEHIQCEQACRQVVLSTPPVVEVDISGINQEQGDGSNWYGMLIGDDDDEINFLDKDITIIDDGCM